MYAKRVGWPLVFAGLLLTFALAAVFLLLRPPLSFVRLVTLGSSRWILTDYRADAGVAVDVEMVIASWVSQAYAGKLASEVEAAEPRGDIELIEQAILKIQLHVLSGAQVPHDPTSSPALVSGVGDCDQINAAVCSILVHWFPRAEIFALYDPETKSSLHTVGRVWSAARHEWLYFDAGFDRPVIYRRSSSGAIDMLVPHAAIFDASRQPPPSLKVYGLHGSVLNVYQSNYLAYLFSKAVAYTPPPPSQPAMPTPPPAAAPEVPVPPPPPTNEAVFAQIRSEYLEARINDLSGEEREADRLYHLVANSSSAGADYRASEFRLAAQHFIAVRDGRMVVAGN